MPHDKAPEPKWSPIEPEHMPGITLPQAGVWECGAGFHAERGGLEIAYDTLGNPKPKCVSDKPVKGSE
jgi:hypothetical protein